MWIAVELHMVRISGHGSGLVAGIVVIACTYVCQLVLERLCSSKESHCNNTFLLTGAQF